MIIRKMSRKWGVLYQQEDRDMREYWKDGIMGVVTGDALGCPVQFESRKEVAGHPVTGMRGFGTFNLPAGSWTDDSSLTLALAESIRRLGGVDYVDIMDSFVRWLDDGAFTPYGYSYDIGHGTMQAILRYKRNHKPHKSGSDDEHNNGNGSLMRILPACLYCVDQNLADREAVEIIHKVGSLTHAHIRANIACGLYYFMAREIVTAEPASSLPVILQKGLEKGFAFYDTYLADQENLIYYARLRNLSEFTGASAEKIKSTGYVVDTLEAAVWSLITTGSFEEALLKAVNLGDDTDTVGAVAGGLAGLYYGYESIPEEWLSQIQKRKWVEGLL